ncbi:MAG: hypothetical protein KDB07_12335, partial [Planctomycetes bacterium]|nr:hypothetical protein [Planctomycetota bacterium]
LFGNPRLQRAAEADDAAGESESVEKQAEGESGLSKRVEDAAMKYGGGKEVLSAVAMALEYLAKHQLDDGRWNLDGELYPTPNPSKPITGKKEVKYPVLNDPGTYHQFDVGATALAMLCFLGADYTIESEKYGKVVKEGLDFLLDCQQSNGSFSDPRNKNGFEVYNSALAFLALAEACVKHPKKVRYKTATRRAYNYFKDCQNENGGWSYYSGMKYGRERNYIDERTDASITGWVALAFYIARTEANININRRVMQKAVESIKKLTVFEDYTSRIRGEQIKHRKGETFYADLTPWEFRKGIACTAIGLTVRRTLEPESFVAVDQAASDLILEQTPKWDDLKKIHDSTEDPNFVGCYAWYYASLGMFFAHGG